MSYFDTYKFISPEPIYAIVKEELKSYFDTGAVDDLMFPIYANKCLEKLGRGMHPILPVTLFVEDFVARLPDNFYAIREAWFCTFINLPSFNDGVSFYSQSSDCNTVQISPITTSGTNPCTSVVCPDPCEGACGETIQAVYKTLRQIPRNCYTRHFLLKPGNISLEPCEYSYNNDSTLHGVSAASPGSATCDSFDIHDNKFVTTFREGLVEVLMYVSDHDDLGNQMIPDNYRIREYIEAFIKFKTFETLTNQTNDETTNQLRQKMIDYKMMADQAYIMAETEIKKQSTQTKKRRIRKRMNSFDKFELPDSKLNRRTRGYRNRF